MVLGFGFFDCGPPPTRAPDRHVESRPWCVGVRVCVCGCVHIRVLKPSRALTAEWGAPYLFDVYRWRDAVLLNVRAAGAHLCAT